MMGSVFSTTVESGKLVCSGSILVTFLHEKIAISNTNVKATYDFFIIKKLN
jgi:hypothetical protein